MTYFMAFFSDTSNKWQELLAIIESHRENGYAKILDRHNLLQDRKQKAINQRSNFDVLDVFDFTIDLQNGLPQ